MMKSERKRKTIYAILKVLGVAISCFFPIWAILEKFPLWREHYGEGRSLSVGMILMLFVVAINDTTKLHWEMSERSMFGVFGEEGLK